MLATGHATSGYACYLLYLLLSMLATRYAYYWPCLLLTTLNTGYAYYWLCLQLLAMLTTGVQADTVPELSNLITQIQICPRDRPKVTTKIVVLQELETEIKNTTKQLD